MFAFFQNWLYGRRAEKQIALDLYETCRVCARQPVFYKESVPDESVPDESVPDNVQGRFEMLAVHLWLVLRHLRRLEQNALAKRLIAVFFSEMDAAMRESGVGDMAVPHRMKAVAQAFYGRLEAYDRAHQQQSLPAAIRRNIAPDLSSSALSALTAYLLASDALMAAAPLRRFHAADRLFASYELL